MKRLSFILAIFLAFSGTTNAQFFKKLGNKIANAAEKAVEKKAVQKTTRETEEAFDSTFNTPTKQSTHFGLTQIDPAASYAFDHKVVMKFTSGKDVMDVDYFLPNSGNFLGTRLRGEKIQDDFITVYDVEREAMFTYLKNEGKKMKMGVAFKADESGDESDDVTIKATENHKTIIGYRCQEYLMMGKDMTATIWVTKEVQIRFPSTLYRVKQNKSNNQEWMKDIDGWAMEMEMTDTSRRKPQLITMKCLSIEPSDYKINSSDYQSIGY